MKAFSGLCVESDNWSWMLLLFFSSSSKMMMHQRLLTHCTDPLGNGLTTGEVLLFWVTPEAAAAAAEANPN